MAAARQVDELTDLQIQLIARALADPHRYAIIKRLRAQPSGTTCSHIRDCIDIRPAKLSHHMKELETAGLVRSQKEGKFVSYFPQTRVLRAYLDRLKSDLA